MKNKLIDLNNHLFAQLERVSDEGISEDDLKLEIKRSQAISGLASQVVANASLALKAEQLQKNGVVSEVPKMIAGEEVPKMLGGKKE